MKGFMIYGDLEQQVASLTDAQVGQLLRAMFEFNRGVEPSPADPLVGLAFGFVRGNMERDRARYEATCEKRKAAGAKGGRPQKQKKQMVSEETPFFNPESKRFSENPDSVPVPEPDPEPVPDSVPVPVTQSMGVSGGTQTETGTPDSENTRDFLDCVAYFDKCGLSLSRGNRRILARWVREVGFDVVVIAVDRAMIHGAKTAGYVFTILEEWKSLGLHDPEAVENHLDGEAIA
ncbi:MAG: DnaD domain protein [Clostridiales bacterium]|nr:DnaD domain protein [Clostridiales bacterium]